MSNNKAVNFLRKNVYYFIFVLCLAVLSIVTIALVVNQNNSNQLGNGGVIETPNDSLNEGNNQQPNENNGGNNDENESQNPPAEENTPVVTVVVFDMPVNGTILKEYVGASVVYNQTLGLYTGHKAIDILADEGAQVKCSYDGVVESITSSSLEGTTITIDHGNNLKTVYNSVEVVENLTEGQNVSKGEVIATVALNNRTEYKDGAHLHFEVIENGVKIDPNKYLLLEEK
ncbi:MAG: M23 family metallopeptidase [Clostridia bacterium]|nr:M23 family metallopeptidase [Clostridia bacterium]